MTSFRPMLVILLGLATPASAQLPDLGALGGGVLSRLGGGVPDIASVGAGNAAGLLGYCVKRQLLGSADTASVLGKLTGNQSVTASPGYAAGQNGQIVTGNGAMSLAGLKDKVKGRLCTLMLDHARGFVTR